MTSFSQQDNDPFGGFTLTGIKSRTPSFGHEEEVADFISTIDPQSNLTNSVIDPKRFSQLPSSSPTFNRTSLDSDAGSFGRLSRTSLSPTTESKQNFLEQIIKMSQQMLNDNKHLRGEINKMKKESEDIKTAMVHLLEAKESNDEKNRNLEFDISQIKKQVSKLQEENYDAKTKLREFAQVLDRSQKDWVSVQDNNRMIKNMFTQSKQLGKSITKSPNPRAHETPKPESEGNLSSIKKAMDFKDFTTKKRSITLNQEYFAELKESFSIRYGTSTSSGKYLPEKLFEDFFVATVPVEAIAEHKREFPNQTNFNLPGKILWNLNGIDSLDEPSKSCIQDFVFPFDINVIELPKEKDRTLLVKKAITGDKKYGKRFVLQFLPGDDLLLLEWDPKIELINPNHFLYYIGFHHKDFVSIDTDQGTTHFYQVNTAIFFKTFYPLSPLFFNLVNTIMDQQKLQRQKLYSSNPDDLARIDFVKSLDLYKYSLRRSLLKIQERGFDFSKTIDVSLDFENQRSQIVSFTPPPVEEIFTLESLWNAHHVFSTLSIEDLYYLFSAVILEKKVIFVSKNISLLTGIISVFLTLIKPLNYTFPVLSLLPEELLDWCDMPSPAMLGLNQTEEYVRKQSLLKLYPTGIFVFLDSKKVFAVEKFPIIKKEIFFKEEDQRLKSVYQSFGEVRSMSISDELLEFEKDSTTIEDIISSPWEKQNEIGTGKKIFQSQAVFLIFKNFLEKILLKEVKQYPWGLNLTKDYHENFDAVKVSMMKGQDKNFLKEFVGTRAFAFYVQNYHAHQMSQITKI